MNSLKNDTEKKSSLSQITEEDYKIIKEIIELIKRDPKSQQFQNPVNTEEYPEYLRIINYNPMDLSTIEKKIRGKGIFISPGYN